MSDREAASTDVGDAAVHVVSYLEAVPPARDETAALLIRYRDVIRKADGIVRLEVLQQSGRPDHFAIIETWRDQSAFDAHGHSTHTRQLRDQLRPLLASPFDDRVHRGLALGSALTARAEGATYVLTHADAIPPAKDDAMSALTELAAASRDESGVVRFEVLQQRSRQNHFTIVEIWSDQQALEQHVMAAHTTRFRERFQPMSGSLYDERLYRALD